jgi:hypothetical protein
MITIFIRTQFAGVHSYPKADGKHEYLQYPHRHIFHVEVEVKVMHEERDIEFLTFKQYIDEYCTRWSVPTTNSCETMARHIALHLIDIKLHPIKVSVSEDGENGSIFYPEYQEYT